MEQKAIIMDESAIRRAVARITYEILERNRGAENLCIVGILSRGVVLAERIARKIYELEHAEVEFGALDITPFRDDRIADATHSAKSTIHFPVQDKRVVIVDDVLYVAAVLPLMRFWRLADRSACSWQYWWIADIGNYPFVRIISERTFRLHRVKPFGFPCGKLTEPIVL